jgi:DNA-binding response OmpR family regulator
MCICIRHKCCVSAGHNLLGNVERLKNCKKSILVIDDDKSILRTFTRILQRGGYEVESAETGKEAIEKAGKYVYDVALIDIRLPDMNGTDLLTLMKSSLSGAVRIMITGLPSPECGEKSLNEGADAYVTKPIMPDELLSLIDEKLKQKKSKT